MISLFDSQLEMSTLFDSEVLDGWCLMGRWMGEDVHVSMEACRPGERVRLRTSVISEVSSGVLFRHGLICYLVVAVLSSRWHSGRKKQSTYSASDVRYG